MPGKEREKLQLGLKGAHTVSGVVWLARSSPISNPARAQPGAGFCGINTEQAGKVRLSRAPKPFRWTVRLKYVALAGSSGWIAGWLACFPFVVFQAWRYVDAQASKMLVVVAKGMVVWGAFSLFMAIEWFVQVMLVFLLLSPRGIVRRRAFLLTGVAMASSPAFYWRMGLLQFYHLRHPYIILDFFFTAPIFFAIIFALSMTWTYVALASRRLSACGSPLRIRD